MALNLIDSLSKEVTRNIGSALNIQFPKPDGSQPITTATALNVVQGTVQRITDTPLARATAPITDGAMKVLGDILKTPSKGGQFLGTLVQNPLENFASYNCLWTMAVLTSEQFNDPSSYRNNPGALTNIVFSSAGRFDDQRVQTLYGAPEYYIQNFRFNALVTASDRGGASNSTTYSFQVYEPYGMGTFLQSLQVAANEANYPDYLQSPIVMKLDFQGYDTVGRIYSSIVPKYFVIKITECKFSVNEAGSTYNIKAIAYNQEQLADQKNILYKDLTIMGSPNGPGTVKEILDTGDVSLRNWLNNNEAIDVRDGKKSIPDVYEFQFPVNAWDYDVPSTSPKQIVDAATANPLVGQFKKYVGQVSNLLGTVSSANQSPIANSSFGFDQSAGGNQPAKREVDARDEKSGVVDRDKMGINNAQRSFQFQQGQKITDVITAVLLSSDYCKHALDEDKISPDGMVNWFKLDVQFQFITLDPATGNWAKKIIYRVTPYQVHKSIFSSPVNGPSDYSGIEKKIVKRYDYIYTGQNTDILKFDITINNLFFRGANSGAEGQTALTANTALGGVAPNPQDTTKATGTNEGATAANTGAASRFYDPNINAQRPKGGSGTTSTKQAVAEAFHKAFLQSNTDLVSIKFEILGDPYYMVDSGAANYFSPADPASPLINADGTANFNGQDIYIYVTWRTPIDVNTGSLKYDFSDGDDTNQFSGIYKITTLENVFENGMWKQILNCIRMPLQPSDFDGQPQDATKEVGIKYQAPNADPSSPVQPEQTPGDPPPTPEPPAAEPPGQAPPDNPLNTPVQTAADVTLSDTQRETIRQSIGATAVTDTGMAFGGGLGVSG